MDENWGYPYFRKLPCGAISWHTATLHAVLYPSKSKFRLMMLMSWSHSISPRPEITDKREVGAPVVQTIMKTLLPWLLATHPWPIFQQKPGIRHHLGCCVPRYFVPPSAPSYTSNHKILTVHPVVPPGLAEQRRIAAQSLGVQTGQMEIWCIRLCPSATDTET